MRPPAATLLVGALALWACDDGADAAADAAPPDGSPAADMAPLADADPAVDAGPAAHPGLLDPSQAMQQAPEAFTVYVASTAGDFLVDVTRAWSPVGADRFYNLTRIGLYDDCAFFRVIDGFVAQTGLPGDPLVWATWQALPIAADPVVESNVRGTVSFATFGGDPETRRTQFFINYGDNSRLDGLGFSPFGMVRDMTPVDELYGGYGEGPPSGDGPDQGRMRNEGNTYLRAEYPELDYIVSARVVD